MGPSASEGKLRWVCFSVSVPVGPPPAAQVQAFLDLWTWARTTGGQTCFEQPFAMTPRQEGHRFCLRSTHGAPVGLLGWEEVAPAWGGDPHLAESGRGRRVVDPSSPLCSQSTVAWRYIFFTLGQLGAAFSAIAARLCGGSSPPAAPVPPGQDVDVNPLIVSESTLLLSRLYVFWMDGMTAIGTSPPFSWCSRSASCPCW